MRTIEWQDRLGQDEQLVWTGAPKPGLRFRLVDLPLTLFGLVFATIGGSIAFSTLPFGLLIPHFWVGIYLAFGRYIVERIVRESTGYAITDQRVLIVRAWPTRTTTSVNMGAVVSIDLTEHRDGSGSIRFRETRDRGRWPSSSRRRQANWTNLTSPAGPSFEYIDHPHQVMELLRVRQASPPPSNRAWPVSYGTPPDPTGQAAVARPTSEDPAPTTLVPALPPPAAAPPVPAKAASGPAPDAEPIPETTAPGPFWRPPQS